MTRFLPKDGRSHQSHTAYSHFCRHGLTLQGHIDEHETRNGHGNTTPLVNQVGQP